MCHTIMPHLLPSHHGACVKGKQANLPSSHCLVNAACLAHTLAHTHCARPAAAAAACCFHYSAWRTSRRGACRVQPFERTSNSALLLSQTTQLSHKQQFELWKAPKATSQA
jgi:hypothetical protein